MIIKQGELKIRTATVKDVQILSDWWNDGKVMAHAGFPNGLGINESEVRQIITNNNLRELFVIELGDKAIGEMNYRTLQKGTAKIGIKICDVSKQNKAYGTKYLKMLMEYIFISKGYEKIVLDTNLKNIRAQKVYEKLGFKRLGSKIDSWENQRGELQSSVDYEITKQDYLSMFG